MHENGFHNAPVPHGVNEEGMEIASFVDGMVYNDSLPSEILTDEVLTDVAKLLCRNHNIGERYIPHLAGEEIWMLPKRSPAEVVCHGDFAPYNMTFVGGCAHGVIDFDTLHPGPRIWDIAYAVYRWVPPVSPVHPDPCSDLDEQIRRLKVFSDAYGLNHLQRKQLPEMMTESISSLVVYMRNESDAGNEDMRENIEDGHLKVYLDDNRYIKENRERILERTA